MSKITQQSIADCITLAAGARDFSGPALRIGAPFPPGGSSNPALHALAERMRVELGQPIIVENITGAGSAISTNYVVKLPPDRYSLLFNGSSLVILPSVAGVNYDPIKDLAPVSQVFNPAILLSVSSDIPVHTVPEVVSYLKAGPGEIDHGSVCAGRIIHTQVGQFQALTLHIPYKALAPALTDLIGGHLQMSFNRNSSVCPYVHNGTFSPLAVAMPQRSSVLPKLQPMAQAGMQDHEVGTWSALLIPDGRSKHIITKLNQALKRPCNTPKRGTNSRLLTASRSASHPRNWASASSAKPAS